MSHLYLAYKGEDPSGRSPAENERRMEYMLGKPICLSSAASTSTEALHIRRFTDTHGHFRTVRFDLERVS